jgi:predicted nuclease of predicted toxin-antitoxin system
MKILIDMNLSPEWIPVLETEGWSAKHWSHIGNPKAEDKEIFAWAAANDYIVFTHDLDFGAILALPEIIVQAFFKFVFKMFCLNQLPLM